MHVANVAREHGKHQRADALYAEALANATPELELLILINRSRNDHRRGGDLLKRARSTLRPLMARIQRECSREYRYHAWSVLSASMQLDGADRAYAAALHSYRHALHTGDPVLIAGSLAQVGVHALAPSHKRPVVARKALTHAFRLGRRRPAEFRLGWICNNLAWLLKTEHRFEEALRYFQLSYSLRRSKGNSVALRKAATSLAYAYLPLGRSRDAVRRFLEIDLRDDPIAGAQLGQCLAMIDPPTADLIEDRAVQLGDSQPTDLDDDRVELRRSMLPLTRFVVQTGRAQRFSATGRPDRAIEVLREAQATYGHPLTALARCALAIAHWLNDDRTDARKLIRTLSNSEDRETQHEYELATLICRDDLQADLIRAYVASVRARKHLESRAVHAFTRTTSHRTRSPRSDGTTSMSGTNSCRNSKHWLRSPTSPGSSANRSHFVQASIRGKERLPVLNSLARTGSYAPHSPNGKRGFPPRRSGSSWTRFAKLLKPGVPFSSPASRAPNRDALPPTANAWREAEVVSSPFPALPIPAPLPPDPWQVDPLADTSPDSLLLLEGFEHLSDASKKRLTAWIQTSPEGPKPWIVATTCDTGDVDWPGERHDLAPLRERLDSLPAMLDSILAELGSSAVLGEGFLERCRDYHWPQNFTELRMLSNKDLRLPVRYWKR